MKRGIVVEHRQKDLLLLEESNDAQPSRLIVPLAADADDEESEEEKDSDRDSNEDQSEVNPDLHSLYNTLCYRMKKQSCWPSLKESRKKEKKKRERRCGQTALNT